jgi:hypothetical protein
MKFKQYPSQSELKQLFNYNPDTGIFTHKTNRGSVKIGSKAGTVNKSDKYHYLKINKEKYATHRLVWIYVYGEIPIGFEIDHINGCEADNRLINLRLATPSQNQHNQKLSAKNTSGVKGICWSKTRQKWVVNIKLNGKLYNLGTFAEHDKASAIAAVMQAREAMHGEFTNHGEIHLARPIPTPTLF